MTSWHPSPHEAGEIADHLRIWEAPLADLRDRADGQVADHLAEALAALETARRAMEAAEKLLAADDQR